MQHPTILLPAFFLSFTAVPASAQGPAPGQLELISRSSAGVQGNSWSSGPPAVSASGQFTAFHSYSDNLVANDTNVNYDIFLRDRLAGTTVRVSVDSSGLQASGSSVYPSISADGNLIAFASTASNLAPGDTNGTWDVFVHDRASGQTRLVSRSTAGVQGNMNSEFPSLSADGRCVAFQSFATNLAPDPNGFTRDAFVHDLMTGETTLVSVGDLGQAANDNCDGTTISDDGRLVAFHSSATNLVLGDTNGLTDVFVRDRIAATTVRVSVDSAGAQSTDGYSFNPAFSGDGRFVAFQSSATLASIDIDGGFFDVYLFDRVAGRTLAVTAADPAFPADTPTTVPAISGDGRQIAFQIAVLVEPCVYRTHVFLHDRAMRSSRALSQHQGVLGNDDSSDPAISATGGVIAFASEASNLVRGDGNAAGDVFVHVD